jgi:BirA family biotin operon repressor/biotin-[acetyl-CoA-carboxylase] ligase
MSADDGPASSIDAQRLQQVAFVRHIELHDVITSTNDVALQAACDPQLQVPALFVAERQMSGRGRGGNRWWSAPGALTCSLVIEPTASALATGDWPRLSLTAAMAACDVLDQLVPQADWGVKWPNDVEVGGRKLGGILIEAPNCREVPARRVVVGIGLNVNNSWSTAPGALRGTATAICDVSGRRHDRTDLLVRWLQAFAIRLDQLATADPVLPTDWRRRCQLRGRHVTVETDRETITGRCLGVAADAQLVVETDAGVRRTPSGTVGRSAPS